MVPLICTFMCKHNIIYLRIYIRTYNKVTHYLVQPGKPQPGLLDLSSSPRVTHYTYLLFSLSYTTVIRLTLFSYLYARRTLTDLPNNLHLPSRFHRQYTTYTLTLVEYVVIVLYTSPRLRRIIAMVVPSGGGGGFS